MTTDVKKPDVNQETPETAQVAESRDRIFLVLDDHPTPRTEELSIRGSDLYDNQGNRMEGFKFHPPGIVNIREVDSTFNPSPKHDGETYPERDEYFGEDGYFDLDRYLSRDECVPVGTATPGVSEFFTFSREEAERKLEELKSENEKTIQKEAKRQALKDEYEKKLAELDAE